MGHYELDMGARTGYENKLNAEYKIIEIMNSSYLLRLYLNFIVYEFQY